MLQDGHRLRQSDALNPHLSALTEVAFGTCAGKLGAQRRGDSALSYTASGYNAPDAIGAGGPEAAAQPSAEQPVPLISAADIALLHREDRSDWLLGKGTYGKVRCENAPKRRMQSELACLPSTARSVLTESGIITPILLKCPPSQALSPILQVSKGLYRSTQEVAARKLAITVPQPTQQLVDAVTALCRAISSPHVVQVWVQTQCAQSLHAIMPACSCPRVTWAVPHPT